MSNDVAVRLTGVGKMYKVFSSRLDNLLDVLGLWRLRPWRPVQYREFWALRRIDLELGRGERIGIVGRNGAGKTTLLKLITGNLAPTEGAVQVRGEVQALMGTGIGFHPDFTGYENIRASLTYHGLSPGELAAAEADIAEFTELAQFLEQPLKTYSAGMQARLAFATATAIKPDILIIDEVLGAGDAYFLSKSSERMRELVHGGASILLVSHALDQILLLCEHAIWLDRGQIVKTGRALDVVRAYQQFIHVLEDRRLKAKNRKVRGGRHNRDQLDGYGETITVRLTLEGEQATRCDVWVLTLWKDDAVEEELLVGNAQDSDTSHASFVMLDSGDWSSPGETDQTICRSLGVGATSRTASGMVAFNLYALYEDADYTIEVSYRCSGPGSLWLEVFWKGALQTRAELPTHHENRTVHRVALPRFHLGATLVSTSAPAEPVVSDPEASFRRRLRPDGDGSWPKPGGPNDPRAHGLATAPTRSSRDHWPGEGSLTIEDVVLTGPDGQERGVFEVGTLLRLILKFVANRTDTFPIIPCAVLYRLDGTRMCCHIGESTLLSLAAGDRREAHLDLGPINLGDGYYVFATALYLKLHPVEESVWYDCIGNGYEFQILGNAPFTGLFEHPGHWRITSS